ncbi:hypothetical protein L1987_82676 [Smallanthus sonchifolius]|uniref:Uncharacterized protein n=1 Tax=Smallanthus sonchifolius TaxID=185202 RepID=A0ACB8YC18_9ASTR|nr:hypothetical protein L1987_82676 [Smallanthus sonchifolius]
MGSETVSVFDYSAGTDGQIGEEDGLSLSKLFRDFQHLVVRLVDGSAIYLPSNYVVAVKCLDLERNQVCQTMMEEDEAANVNGNGNDIINPCVDADNCKTKNYHGCLNDIKDDDIIIGSLLLIDSFQIFFFGVKSGSYCFGSFVKILERV